MDSDKREKRADITAAMKRCNLLRGLLAIWIVFGHCSGYMTVPSGILDIVRRFNLVCVGIFFFLSGFGLENSLQTKSGYLKFFLPRKCGGLFLMALLQYIVGFVTGRVMGFLLPYEDLWDMLSHFARDVNWFIWELMLFYLLFYLTARLIRPQYVRMTLMLLLSVVMIALLRRTDAGGSWYFSSLAFPAGMAVRIFKEPLEKHFRFVPALLILLVPTAAAGAAGFLLKGSDVLQVYAKNLFCVCIALGVAVLMTKIPLRGKVLSFLALISPEIFLYQFTAASIMLVWARDHRWAERGYGFVLCNVLLTMLLAPIFCGIRMLAVSAFRRRRKKEGAVKG